MNTILKYSILCLVFSFSNIISSQESLEKLLPFEEYLAYVKKHHPLMKQANLVLSIGEANLLKARGGFDPKIEIDYDRKLFKNTKYFDQLNTTFKIPTWYGVEFKANFENNTGAFLNPNLTVPKDGLYSAGVSFSLAQGFLINERMASLKKARFFKEQTKANRDLLVNNLLFKASKAYFNWLEATNAQRIHTSFLDNARKRLEAVKRSVLAGDKATIDITEARIALQNRQLNLEAATLKYRKTLLIVSNYLWLNNVPIEIQENVIPTNPEIATLKTVLLLDGITNLNILVNTHPKLLSIDAKINELTIDRSLKRNKLLPKLDFQYNFLSTNNNQISNFNTSNYKAFVNFSIPLFLRKARGNVKLANLKLQDANFVRVSTSLNLKNKVEAVQAEIKSLNTQNGIINTIVNDYRILLNAEERKFFLGESSLFLINSREQKLIDSQLKKNKLLIKQLIATASLYNTLGVSEPIDNI